MADSKTSRTLPSNSRRKHRNQDPYRLVEQLLMRVANELVENVEGKQTSPRSVVQIWQQWYAIHQKRALATMAQQALETSVLATAGGFPFIELTLAGEKEPIKAHSFADIERRKSKLDPENLEHARARLRRLQENWNIADVKHGYSSARAIEQDLAKREEALSRLVGRSKSKSVIELTAKLHCLLAMEAPGGDKGGTPWPELQIILRDLGTIHKANLSRKRK